MRLQIETSQMSICGENKLLINNFVMLSSSTGIIKKTVNSFENYYNFITIFVPIIMIHNFKHNDNFIYNYSYSISNFFMPFLLFSSLFSPDSTEFTHLKLCMSSLRNHRPGRRLPHRFTKRWQIVWWCNVTHTCNDLHSRPTWSETWKWRRHWVQVEQEKCNDTSEKWPAV